MVMRKEDPPEVPAYCSRRSMNATPPTSRAGSRKGEQSSLESAQDVASAVRQERMSQGVRLFTLPSGYPRPSRRKGGARLAQLEERARRGGGLPQLYAYFSCAVSGPLSEVDMPFICLRIADKITSPYKSHYGRNQFWHR